MTTVSGKEGDWGVLIGPPAPGKQKLLSLGVDKKDNMYHPEHRCSIYMKIWDIIGTMSMLLYCYNG